MPAFLVPVVTFLVRTLLPFLWCSILLPVLSWLLRYVVIGPIKWIWSGLLFLWRYLVAFALFLFGGIKSIIAAFLGMSLKTRILLWIAFLFKYGSFFKWGFIFLFFTIAYKVLEAFGINLFAVVIKYLIAIFAKVLDVLLTLIFGLIDFDPILRNFNEYYNALPACFVEIMLALGLSEALNSTISTAVLCISIRFAMAIIRR